MPSRPYSLVIPVYRNEGSLPELLSVLEDLDRKLDSQLQVVFVVDGSPDASLQVLERELPSRAFASLLLSHSKNFGAFQAIRTGLAQAGGEYFAVMAADLQEPPSLVLDIFNSLQNEPVDVVIGTRESRQDPLLTALNARLFWGLYRRLVQKEMPSGGFDIFGCNRTVRDNLVRLEEANSSLVGQVLWLGFRRKAIAYHREARQQGKSAWTLKKKLRYMTDSIFSFTDLPILCLFGAGMLSILAATVLALLTVVAKLAGDIPVPGYAMTMIVICFFWGLNALGLGIIGVYVWRAYENTKGRPLGVVSQAREFTGALSGDVLSASSKSV